MIADLLENGDVCCIIEILFVLLHKKKKPGVITSIEKSGRGPYRDCTAKVSKKWNIPKIFSKKFSPATE